MVTFDIRLINPGKALRERGCSRYLVNTPHSITRSISDLTSQHVIYTYHSDVQSVILDVDSFRVPRGG